MVSTDRSDSSRTLVVLRAAYVVAVAGLLAVGWIVSGGDGGIVIAWGMVVLTFPSGLLVILLAASATMHMTMSLPGLDLILWLLVASVGYFQWFVMVPWMLTKRPGRDNSQ